MKVQLINAPLADVFLPSIRAGAVPPLHLAALAAYVRTSGIDASIEILDGELIPTREIIAKLDADVVGISCNSLTYDAALYIARAAKTRGAYVVMGGAHPTFAAWDIVRNRPYVDLAVVGDGEAALGEILRGKPACSIPNAVYRDHGIVAETAVAEIPFRELPSPDYSGMDLESYHRRYRSLYPDKPFNKAFAALSAKGCQWRVRSRGGCVFCAIQHHGFRIKSPHRFWGELMEANQRWGADFIWDVSDTFTMQRDWIRRFLKTKPQSTPFRFQVYGRSSDIDEEMADLLAQIGVYETFLGVESGSNDTLKASRKGISAASNIRAIRHLNRAGIRAVISIVLGLPEESEETINATKSMVAEIVNSASLSEMNCSLMLPLPGSRSMQMLREHFPAESGKEDLFEPDVLRKQWISLQCRVSYERLLDVQGEMRTLHHRVGTFGLTA
jgi:anaerobic magnesium-protoporphyrin IX monomethyl ester cyclase